MLAATLAEWQLRCDALEAELAGQRAARRKQIDRYIATNIEKSLRNTWRAWVDEVTDQKRLSGHCESLRTRMIMMTVRKCLSSWIKEIARMRERRSASAGAQHAERVQRAPENS